MTSPVTYNYWTVLEPTRRGKSGQYVLAECRCGKRLERLLYHLTSGQSKSCGCSRTAPTPRLCSIDGCTNKHNSHGWCKTHWMRWKKHGDPNYTPPTPVEKFHARYTKDASGCWLWIGAITARGYGEHYVGDRTVLAHRFGYEHLVGPVPDGLQLDHLCRVRRCVNPGHLEPVTQAENIRRGDSPTAKAARTNRCQRGHAFDEANTYTLKNGYRECRACRLERQKRKRQARRALTCLRCGLTAERSRPTPGFAGVPPACVCEAA